MPARRSWHLFIGDSVETHYYIIFQNDEGLDIHIFHFIDDLVAHVKQAYDAEIARAIIPPGEFAHQLTFSCDDFAVTVGYT